MTTVGCKGELVNAAAGQTGRGELQYSYADPSTASPFLWQASLDNAVFVPSRVIGSSADSWVQALCPMRSLQLCAARFPRDRETGTQTEDQATRNCHDKQSASSDPTIPGCLSICSHPPRAQHHGSRDQRRSCECRHGGNVADVLSARVLCP